MKKLFLALLCLSTLLLYGCAVMFSIDVSGVLVCDELNLSVDFDTYQSHFHGYMGEMTDEDGTSRPVFLQMGHGADYLLEYSQPAIENGTAKTIFKGDCVQIGSAVLFETTDGQQFLLKPQREE